MHQNDFNDNIDSVKSILYTRFFYKYKQPSCWGSNVKNGLKIKQLAKQRPTLKTLLQKNFGWTLRKKLYFFNF